MIYYNENDPSIVAWLRELIAMKAIPNGYVDDRSILDVEGADLKGFSQHHFFAGIGVWAYALERCNWPSKLSVFTGSCPCQPFSLARKQEGINDERHLWPAFHELIKQYNPDIVIGEQVASPDVLGRVSGKPKSTDQPVWIDIVQTDLENSQYTVGAIDLPAASYGAPHIRPRTYWCGMANTIRARPKGWLSGWPNPERETLNGCTRPSCADNTASNEGQEHWKEQSIDWIGCADGKYRPIESGIVPLVDGITYRMVPGSDPIEDANNTYSARGLRIKGYGNAINAQAGISFTNAILSTL